MKNFLRSFVLLFLGLGLVLTGCESKQSSTVIDGAKARELVQKGALLLDVRTPMEFTRGHIDGSVNIPLANLETSMGQFDKARPIVVYCQSGNRSKVAQGALASAGYTVYDLGAIFNW